MVVLHLCRETLPKSCDFSCNVLYCVFCNLNIAQERHTAPMPVRTSVSFYSDRLPFFLSELLILCNPLYEPVLETGFSH